MIMIVACLISFAVTVLIGGKVILPALRRMKVETGSLICFGCGHEHNCNTRGCALMG